MSEIIWNLCKDRLPEPDGEATYLVTTATHAEPRTVSIHIGKYCPPWEGDTHHKPGWVVLENYDPRGEEPYPLWEPPEFWNCSVVAWAELPKPWGAQ